METKSKLRQVLKARRQALVFEQRHAASVQIEEKLHWLINWQAELVVHAYSAQLHLGEVETAHFIDYLTSSCPQVTLHAGRADKAAAIPTAKFDVIIVPLVGFDEAGNRLGMGGGWYDRFLAVQPHALTIGLAFECQKVPLVPIEAHDQSLDVIVTEAAIYRN